MKKKISPKDKVLLTVALFALIGTPVWLTVAKAFGPLGPIGLISNPTPSVPVGFYRAYHAPLKRGMIVSFCPQQSIQMDEWKKREYWPTSSSAGCPHHYVALLKPVAALANDRITLSAAGASVNGHSIPNSKPMLQDERHRPLSHYPYGIYTVNPGQVWLISHYIPDSLDSRYFGPVPQSAILSPMKRIGP